MILCVYGAASNKIDKEYKEKTFELCKKLAERGHSLVFGAGAGGLMGAAAQGFTAGGGKTHGVIPKFFVENNYEGIFDKLSLLTYTDTMAERKSIMENQCEAFIITPGGIGTLEEFFQVLTLKQLGRHKKAIAIYNIKGYYDTLEQVIIDMVEKGFINRECLDLFVKINDESELINYVENYTPDNIAWSRLKTTDEE